MKSKSHLGTLWASMLNRGYGMERRVFAALELLFFPLSLLTVFGLLPLQIVAKRLSWEMPTAWPSVFHILLSAAIGYITNYIALEMLFKPFERSGRHWLAICTLGYWKQGLVPKNKKSIGVEIGRQIETKLLPPDKLADELCSAVSGVLAERKITEDVRQLAARLVGEHHDEICMFLIEKGEAALDTMLEKYVTKETIRQFLQTAVIPRLNTPKIREMAIHAILAEIEKHSSEIVSLLREEIRSMAKNYCEKMSGGMGLMGLLGLPSTMIDKVLDSLDWGAVEERLIEKLYSDKTHSYADTLLTQILNRLGSWMNSDESNAALETLATEIHATLQDKGRQLLKENIPSLIDQFIGYEPFWQWLDETLLPTMLPVVEGMIREKGHEMVMSKLRLAERVSESIDRQDTRQFYEMINALAAQHLGAIQVLGYLLGAVIGALQLLA